MELKKLIVFVLAIMIVIIFNNEQASAYDGGLLAGRAALKQDTKGGNYGITYAITDNDESTGEALGPKMVNAEYAFTFVISNPDLINITGYRIKASGGSLALIAEGTSGGYLLYETNPDTSGQFVSVNVNNIGVLYVINNSTTESTMVYEIDVFGEYVDNTPPEVPIGLVGVPGPGNVELTWNAVITEDIQGYNVYVNGMKKNIFPVVDTSLLITGLSGGVEYSFTVSAIDLSGNESAKSEPLIMQPLDPPDTEPPSIPTNVQLVAGNAQVGVSWTHSSDNVGVSGYWVYRNGFKTTNDPVSGTSYLDTGLINGTTYTYQITAIDAAGNESDKSAPVAVKPTDLLTVTLVPNKDSIVVLLNNGYPPYSIDWGDGQESVNSTSYLITGLTEDTDYTITVTDDVGQSITQIINTGSYKSYVPPIFPSPGFIYQEMLDNFGGAGTVAIAIIAAAIALGLICILGIYGWRLAKRWLATTR